MARYFQLMARVFCVGAMIVIAAVASRQAYLRSTAEADVAEADEEPATMMMIRCETMHNRLQSRPLRLRMQKSGHALVVVSPELANASQYRDAGGSDSFMIAKL